jgi:hypothetical protein
VAGSALERLDTAGLYRPVKRLPMALTASRAASHPPQDHAGPPTGDGLKDRSVADAGLDIVAVATEYDRIVSLACPEQRLLAGRVFERIQPDRWTLEWSLPRWLGEAFGMDPEVIAEIVLSNVLGLGAIRLEDDLVDGDVPPVEVAGARVLGAALFDAAVRPYRAMFAADSPFWTELDRRMSEWRAAARHDVGALAARGAPLQVSAYAVCLAAHRPEFYPALERCLDHALQALVLYDHAADWEADLDAGRWNAFVAAMVDAPDLRAARERLGVAVRVALMTSDRAEAFFARVADQASRAAAAAGQLPVRVPRLVDHLESWAAEVEHQGVAYRGRYLEFGDRAARLLLQGITDG